MTLLSALRQRLTPASWARDALERAHRALESGDPSPAGSLAREVLARRPDDAQALQVLGVSQHLLGYQADALNALERAATLAPGHPRIAFNLGVVRIARGDRAGAIAAFERAVELDPGHAGSWFNLGIVRGELADGPAAEAALRRAHALDPADRLAALRLAQALLAEADRLGDPARHDEVITLLLEDDAGATEPDTRLRTLGRALAARTRWSEALAAFEQALAQNPQDPWLHNEIANACNFLGRMSEAVAHSREVMRLAPGWPHASISLLGSLNYPDIGADAVADEHRRIGAAWAARTPRLKQPDRTQGSGPLRLDGPLRVGYVSPDFRRHPVGWLFAPVLEHHDRAHIETWCYHSPPSPAHADDAMTLRIRGAAAHWVDARGLSDNELAARIAADGIDLLVDLAGQTFGARLSVFAAKPAPVQASWLGYFNTTGLPTVDAFITDPYSSPEGQDRWFSEKLVRLPQTRFCFAAPPYMPEPGPLPALARGRITFGCCNHLGKLNPRVLALWAEILAALPDARLLVQARALDDAPNAERFAATAEAAGIARSRLVLRRFQPAELSARIYREIDIALDPFPFCGGQTSLDALWMGVPVVTLAGELIAGRQTTGFLANLGLEKFSARDAAGYRDIAIALARDTGALAGLRAGLRGRMRASPLCDVPGFTRNLERAWLELCGR